MKKIVSILLVFVLVLSICACSKQEHETPNTEPSTTVQPNETTNATSPSEEQNDATEPTTSDEDGKFIWETQEVQAPSWGKLEREEVTTLMGTRLMADTNLRDFDELDEAIRNNQFFKQYGELTIFHKEEMSLDLGAPLTTYFTKYCFESDGKAISISIETDDKDHITPTYISISVNDTLTKELQTKLYTEISSILNDEGLAKFLVYGKDLDGLAGTTALSNEVNLSEMIKPDDATTYNFRRNVDANTVTMSVEARHYVYKINDGNAWGGPKMSSKYALKVSEHLESMMNSNVVGSTNPSINTDISKLATDNLGFKTDMTHVSIYVDNMKPDGSATYTARFCLGSDKEDENDDTKYSCVYAIRYNVSSDGKISEVKSGLYSTDYELPDSNIEATAMRDRNINFIRALIPGLEPTADFEDYGADTPMVKDYTKIAQRAELKLSVFEESYNDSATVQVNFENTSKNCSISFNMQMTLARDLYM